MNTRRWRWTNAALAAFWTASVPISYLLGWLSSVTYVSMVSLYANIAAHAAAWRADAPDDELIERLDRIEAALQRLEMRI